MITMILLVIGGLNLGLTGLGMLIGMDLNILNMLLGAWPMVEAIVYLLVGVAAIMLLVCHMKKKCGACACDSGASAPTPPEAPSEGSEM